MNTDKKSIRKNQSFGQYDDSMQNLIEVKGKFSSKENSQSNPKINNTKRLNLKKKEPPQIVEAKFGSGIIPNDFLMRKDFTQFYQFHKIDNLENVFNMFFIGMKNIDGRTLYKKNLELLVLKKCIKQLEKIFFTKTSKFFMNIKIAEEEYRACGC